MAKDRVTPVHTPLGDDVLIFTHLSGRDEISRCFEYKVGFVSSDMDVDPLAMLGKPVTVEAHGGDPKRFYNGLVSEFRLTRIADKQSYYEARINPWLWFLGTTTDCRIFQNMTTVEIVEDIFSKYKVAKFEKRLQGSYPPREYCVQYDETDLDFVQRLLEHEGIFYFFEHADGEHTLVLCDAMSKLKKAEGYDKIPYNFEAEGHRRDVEYITDWIPISAVRSGAYTHTDYDFTKPGADLMAKAESPIGHSNDSGEQYHQPGAHLDVGRGQKVADIRLEELQAPQRRTRASGTTRGLFSGCKFELENFPRDDQNAEYLVVSAEHRLIDPSVASDADARAGVYTVTLEVAPTKVIYRPPRITRRPIMRGPQTATVVGPSGEEIYTDKYARVKVQFHWDRKGKKDQNSSCFVRVSSVWAGSNWGFIQIPRIGQEVIVDFIEGDPDLPIITGRVYNASQMPPYELPANATQSGWKSRSSKGGGPANFNEIRFEDKKGSEQVYFHAEKDNDNVIEHDRTKFVGHDQSDRIDHDAKHSVGHNLDEDVGNNKTVSVGVNQTTTIGNNDTESVGVNRSLTVGANETISVGSNSTETIGIAHTQTVGAVQTITVGAARIDSVGAAETRTVGAVQSNTIGASRSVTVGAGQTHSIGASDGWQIASNQTVTIGGAHSESIAKDQTSSVGGARATSVAKDDSTAIKGGHTLSIDKDSMTNVKQNGTIKIGKKLLITAGDEITIKTGSASIVMKKDGTIAIEGKDISVKGSGKINVKASGDITMKGSKINEN